ncbi:pectic acid lyase-domain-containing protein [Hyaloraphidium curvatum]|nr:pectic acid lyase-domain-containing protein [Hyaloraphidium curvatum]
MGACCCGIRRTYVLVFLLIILVVGIRTLRDGPPPLPPPPPPTAWEMVPQRPWDWFSSPHALDLAKSVVSYEREGGGWPAGVDFSGHASTASEHVRARVANLPASIAEGSTVAVLQFFARVIAAQPVAEGVLRDAFHRGVQVLVRAQDASGGWPATYPPDRGNEGTISWRGDGGARAAHFLRSVGLGESPYRFVDVEVRSLATEAFRKALAAIRASQISGKGNLTAWCGAYEASTMLPAPVDGEPAALSARDSAGLLKLLLSIPDPDEDLISAIESAVAWFKSVAILGMRLESEIGRDGAMDVKLAPVAFAPPLWARLYDLQTHHPVFVDEKGALRTSYGDLSLKVKARGDWIGYWPNAIVDIDYPRWADRLVFVRRRRSAKATS